MKFKNSFLLLSGLLVSAPAWAQTICRNGVCDENIRISRNQWEQGLDVFNSCQSAIKSSNPTLDAKSLCEAVQEAVAKQRDQQRKPNSSADDLAACQQSLMAFQEEIAKSANVNGSVKNAVKAALATLGHLQDIAPEVHGTIEAR